MRSLAMAEKSKIPKILLYMVQRIGAVKSLESKKVLQNFKERMGNNHEQYEIMMAVEKILKEK
jgi:2-oxo-4-hydroxy-4-carboxy--5-ureidoimidazoline (OHCU) decarboxylase